jgi:hypothetical protein
MAESAPDDRWYGNAVKQGKVLYLIANAAGLMRRTSSGRVHDERSYRTWLEKAGF